jgi:hypothetical protein
MRHLANGLAALAVAAVALGAVACNKGPAETALASVDAALSAARPELERYSPDALARLDTALAEARAQFARGEYTEALKQAQALPAQVQEAVAAAEGTKAQMTAAWRETSDGLPGLVEAIAGRLAALGAARSLPPGTTREALAAAQAEHASIAAAWSEAVAAFEAGDVPGAVRVARDLTPRAEALASALGVERAPAGELAPH